MGHIGQILTKQSVLSSWWLTARQNARLLGYQGDPAFFILETAMENNMEEVVQQRLFEATRLCYDDGVPIVLFQILRWSYLEKGLEGARSTFKQIKAAYRGGSKDLGPLIMEFAGICVQFPVLVSYEQFFIAMIFESHLLIHIPNQSIFAAHEA